MVRVVVTGLGVRCAGAGNTAQFWKNVTEGRGAVAEVTGLDIGRSECRVGGQISDLEDTGASDPRDRVAHLLFTALREAIGDAGIDLDRTDRSRLGVALGQCQAGFYEDGYARFLYANADLVAAELGITGPRAVLSTACTAGAAALALAAQWIVDGETDLTVAGGVDQLFGPTWQGFSSLQALSPQGCEAYSRSRGLVLGEGAGVLVLESLEGALERGARPIAELKGWGSSADAYHVTAPDPSGRGAVLAMTRALGRAGLTPEDVDYVCGHGTGTGTNDAMEIKAMRAMFGGRAPAVPLSSIKPMIGHTLGAAGAIEAVATVLALRDQILPPTVNFAVGSGTVESSSIGSGTVESGTVESDTLAPGAAAHPPDLDFVPNVARPARIDVAVSNNYAFGGDNSSLVFCRPGLGPDPRTGDRREVVITGVGAHGAIGSGFAQWSEALLAGRSGLGPARGFDATGLPGGCLGELPELDPRGVAGLSEWRQMDPLSRLALAVARQAWNDADLRLTAAQRNETAVVLATATGPLSAISRFTDTVRAGEPSPVLFPNTVFTSSSGHVCRALRLRGPRTTFSSGSAAAVHAIEYASTLLASGVVDHAIVIAVEEVTRMHLTTPGRQQGYLVGERGVPFQKGSPGINLGAAGVAFVLEPAAQARARGVRVHGTVLGCAVGGDALPVGAVHSELDPRGTQWEAVMRRALSRAGVEAHDVGYIAAVANGAALLDSVETGVLARVFGRQVPVSAPKAAVGETQGAGGAVAVLAGLVALGSGVAPPTADLTEPVGAHRIRHVLPGGAAVPITADTVLANAFSLGGTYGSVVIGR